MSSYEELIAGKSLDELLRKANEEKNDLSKRETALVPSDKVEINKDDFLSETEKLLDYFNICMPFKTVYSHLRKLQDIDINHDIFLSDKLLISGTDLHYLTEKYTERMGTSNLNRGFVIGDKVITVYDGNKIDWEKEYFYDRNNAFSFGSIGEICMIGFMDGCYVRFSFPPKSDWPMISKPSKEYKRWATANGASDNAQYEKNELQFVPLNLIEKRRIMYEVDNLVKKIDDFARAKK